MKFETHLEALEAAMSTDAEIVHVHGPRESGTSPNIAERFCRPGAVFGNARLEQQMGVRVVYHEQVVSNRSGQSRCVLCGINSG